MRRELALTLVAVALALGQALAQSSATEQEELSAALAEAGSSRVEFLRAIEKHLEKYPNSTRTAELERAALRAAIEVDDNARIIRYGDRVLQRGTDDAQLLDRVTRALLSGGPDTSERALEYARRLEEVVAGMRKKPAPTRMSKAAWLEELDRTQSHAFLYQARAARGLQRFGEAVALARRSWETYPTAAGAREIAAALERSGKLEEAARHLADAFTVPDPGNTDASRARDRARMGELYGKVNGSEAGLGELVLAAYDRTAALVNTRKLRYRESDPNSAAARPLEFTLSSLHGPSLRMASLSGKVIVLDFWATWCIPCRAQHPLYEEVKKRYEDNAGVVFLSINTDGDRTQVQPFLDEQKWTDKVYFEDGMSRVLNVSSIPTTVIIDRRGAVSSRMNGFVPERFVEMLDERIREALSY
jgi:thiol-disulfide isomerase/thioredoxin